MYSPDNADHRDVLAILCTDWTICEWPQRVSVFRIPCVPGNVPLGPPLRAANKFPPLKKRTGQSDLAALSRCSLRDFSHHESRVADPVYRPARPIHPCLPLKQYSGGMSRPRKCSLMARKCHPGQSPLPRKVPGPSLCAHKTIVLKTFNPNAGLVARSLDC
jgi:hypothetical protein